jgi:hypothetical protein
MAHHLADKANRSVHVAPSSVLDLGACGVIVIMSPT